MAPPGPIGTGSVSTTPPLTWSVGDSSVATSSPTASFPQPELAVVSSKPPSAGLLTGKKIVLVVNPAAQDGKVGREKGAVEHELRKAGANVQIIETVPDRAQRLDNLRAVLARSLSQLPEGQRLIVLTYGGDTTVGETLEALNRIQNWHPKVDFFVPDKGTAADLAVQANAPPKPKDFAGFIQNAVRLPIHTPIITSKVGRDGTGIHSMGIGIGAALFRWRSENKATSPTSWHNKGVISYLRLLPRAMVSPYGWNGFDYEIQVIRGSHAVIDQTFRATDVLLTPSRIIGRSTAIPGKNGTATLAIIPTGLHGIKNLFEVMGLGFSTTVLGLNRSGPGTRHTLGDKNLIPLQPGDSVEVNVRLPRTLRWRIFKGLERWGIIKPIGFGEGLSERVGLPNYGEPIKMPAFLNGDGLDKPTSRLEVKIPKAGLEASILARPGSLAVDNSTDPLVLRNDGNNGTQIVRTPLFETKRIEALAKKLGVSPERIPELLALHGEAVTRNKALTSLAKPNFNLESLERFPDQEKTYQSKWLYSQSNSRALLERARMQGVPLVLGFGAYWAAESALEHFEIDFGGDPVLHFGAVTYATHALQSNVTPLWEAALNRRLRTPFDYARTRTLNLGGKAYTQWTLARHQTWRQAMRGAWASSAGYLGPGAHYSTGLKLFRGALLPLRAGFNMGLGMVMAGFAQRATESWLSGEPEQSWSKEWLPTITGFGGFAAPNLTHIISPRFSKFIFQNRLAQGASVVAGAGFLADLGFSSLHGLHYGALSGLETQMGLRVLESKKQSGELSGFTQGLSYVAPSLAAHLVSHDGLFGRENETYHKLKEQDHEAGKALVGAMNTMVPTLLQEVGWSWRQGFSERRELDPLDKMIAKDLGFWLKDKHKSLDSLALRLRRNYSGYSFSQQEAKEKLAHILLAQIQEQIAAAFTLQLPYTKRLRTRFQVDGTLIT